MLTVSRVYAPALPTDLRHTLGSLRRSTRDPTMRFSSNGLWRATRTPDGPGVQHLRQSPHSLGPIESSSFGPGAQWLADHLPALLGAGDHEDDFPISHPKLNQWHARYRGLRIARTEAVWEAAYPAVLEQKVTGKEAWESFRLLHYRLSGPAPTPPNGPKLLLPLDPRQIANTPSHEFMNCNVERKRSTTIRVLADHASRLEQTVSMSRSDYNALFQTFPGVGAWTAAEIAIRALGDADAVSIGDFHLKNHVAWNLADRPRGTDDEMLELLEPFRPFRGKVVLLMQLAGEDPPKYGPHLAIQKRW